MSRSHCGPPAKHCKCCNGSHDVLGRVATVTAVSPSPKSANVMNLCFRGKAEEGKQALTGRLADGTDHRQGPNIFPKWIKPMPRPPPTKRTDHHGNREAESDGRYWHLLKCCQQRRTRTVGMPRSPDIDQIQSGHQSVKMRMGGQQNAAFLLKV